MDDKKKFFKIFIFLTIIYLSFQTKPWGSVGGGIFSGDDYSYYGYISSLVNDFDLDFSNNELSGYSGISPITGKIVVGHPIGTSILLMPFYVIAKPIVCLIRYITNTPFNQKHPLFFMFMCSGIIIYAYLGGYFLFKTIESLGINPKISTISVILSIWGTILPAYIFRRPILSHVPEFFLISLLIYLIVRWKNNGSVSLKQSLILALVCGMVIITRWNNVHILCFSIYWLIIQRNHFSGVLKNSAFVIILFFAVIFLVFFFTQSLAWKYFVGTYFTLFPLNRGAGLSEIFSLAGLRNLIHIFFGLDWGLLYTMLPFVVGLISFLWLNPLSLSRRHILERIIYFLILSLPFIIVLRWQRQADYYGYRYLLSLLPFTCIGLALLFNKIHKRFLNSEKILLLLMIVILIFNFLIILPFEFQESTNLEWGVSIMGGEGYVNNHYVLNAIKIYFSSSAKTLIGLFTRGFLGGYVFGGIYLASPQFFERLSNINPKIHQYYALDTPERWIILMFPIITISILFLINILINKFRREKCIH